MAKIYARLNWENSPSQATPRNAENLNVMDKGIDDLDNAVVTLQSNKIDKTSIVATDTVNDNTKVAGAGVVFAHGVEIDALNTNLVNRTNKTYTGTIEGDYKNTVAENWSIMPHGVSIALLAQSSIAYVLIGKTSELYGSVQITGYILNAPVYGTLNGGVWVWS